MQHIAYHIHNVQIDSFPCFIETQIEPMQCLNPNSSLEKLIDFNELNLTDTRLDAQHEYNFYCI